MESSQVKATIPGIGLHGECGHLTLRAARPQGTMAPNGVGSSRCRRLPTTGPWAGNRSIVRSLIGSEATRPGTLTAQTGSGPLVDPSSKERRHPWVLAGLFVAVFTLPFIAYFWFIQHYAVDAIWYDQWWDVQLLQHWYSGGLNVSELWAQHGNNRILFPNLVMILLAATTRLNTVVEEFVSGALLSVSVALIMWTHKRRSKATIWIWYLPVALVLLSFVQYQDTLWGFQLAWYMAFFALALSLYLLDPERLGWLGLAPAVAVAVVGSFSSIQGLLIWPVGLLLLYQRRRAGRLMIVWAIAAVSTIILYFYDIQQGGLNPSSFLLHHPVKDLQYFLLALGDVIGVSVSRSASAGDDTLMVLGLIILLLACWTLVNYGWRRDDTEGSPIGVALTLYGLLFAAIMTFGRATSDLAVAGTSRYTTFDLLIPVGCYLTWLGPRSIPSTSQDASRITAKSRPATLAVLALLIVLQVVLGTSSGLVQARNWYLYQRRVANITVNATRSDSGLETMTLLPCHCPLAKTLPTLTRTVRQHRLSMYSTSDARNYRRMGLPIDTTPPVTRLLQPRSGAKLKGSLALNASASDEVSVTRVEFEITGGSLHDAVIATAVRFVYGWLGGWNTRTVPDGSYTLRSVAFDAAGNSGHSAGVIVTVTN